MSVDSAAVKAVNETIGTYGTRAVDLSRSLHAHPEVGYQEVRAAGWLCDELDDLGLSVTSAYCDLPTAFRASIGSGPLRIALLAEYDALPGIGHACGHNIIAAAALAAAAALTPLVDDLGLSLSVIGTPAEEQLSRGGKIVLLERGAFDDVDAAMMIHPTPFEFVAPTTSAARALKVAFQGRPAHAGAAPQLGLNAADAMTVAQVGIGLLRQQLAPDARVSGYVTVGGDAANIIPARSEAEYILRSADAQSLASLTGRVADCFAGGALATGCELDFDDDSQPYAELWTADFLADIYKRHAEALGRTFDSAERLAGFVPSTDAGNVSHVLPLIHPYVGLGGWPVVNHQPEFAALCATPTAEQALLAGAEAMARTVVELGSSESLREQVRGRRAGDVPK